MLPSLESQLCAWLSLDLWLWGSPTGFESAGDEAGTLDLLVPPADRRESASIQKQARSKTAAQRDTSLHLTPAHTGGHTLQ